MHSQGLIYMSSFGLKSLVLVKLLVFSFPNKREEGARRVQEPAVHRVTGLSTICACSIPVHKPGFRVLSSSEHNAVIPVA